MHLVGILFPPINDNERSKSHQTTLCVLQEGEISADLFTFHEAVSQLQVLEEEVLDSHTSVAQMMPQWMELDRALLAMTNDVDYDQDGEICSSRNHHSSQTKSSLLALKTLYEVCWKYILASLLKPLAERLL